MTTFHLITVFPEIFTSYFSQTILSRAQKNKLIKIQIHDLRKFARAGDAHKSVDDRPYGGGPGMILMVEPIFKALRALKVKSQKLKVKSERVIMLTPTGKKYTQRDAERLAKYNNIILLCGRYEGFDARAEKLVDEKISIGDYVLAGGELPAMVLVETIARQLPGVVGHKHALDEETFSPPSAKAMGGKRSLDYIEYPQYTRPEIFAPKKGTQWRVPKVLLSGNHKKIKGWQKSKSK